MKTRVTLRGGPLIVGLLFAAIQASTALAKAEVREEFRQTYPLTSDGEVALENVNGKAQIMAWDRTEVRVAAVKRAAKSADLDAVKIEVEAKPNRVKIVTKHPSMKWGRGNSTRVDYTLTVPRHASLKRVTSVNGEILVEGVRGSMEIATVNGALTVKGLVADAELSSVNGAVQAGFDRTDTVKSVSVKTVNGRAEVILPAAADAEISAKSVNGGIHTDFGLSVTKHWLIGQELKATLGKGGARIHAETVNGGIRIRRGLAAEKE